MKIVQVLFLLWEESVFYENNECKEQFIDCSSYEKYGEQPLEKSICESIVLNNTYSSKCVFSYGSNSNKCEEPKLFLYKS